MSKARKLKKNSLRINIFITSYTTQRHLYLFAGTLSSTYFVNVASCTAVSSTSSLFKACYKMAQ